jgi:myo-inositol-1(or 4)-monophosphatase
MTPQETAERLDCMDDALRQAGAIALKYFRHPDALNIASKGLHDVVTVADRAVEEFLVGRISGSFPQDGIVGEEGSRRGQDSKACWYLDPVDGTTNFARGIPFWCISAGLLVDGRAELGIIYDPVTDEMFSARHGCGATCNGQPIHTSAATTPQTSRINLGFNFRSKLATHLAAIDRLTSRQCEYVRLGSTALGLAYVANGRLEGTYASHTQSWDVMAAICLVTEAGGYVSDFISDNRLGQGSRLLAAAPGVTQFLRDTLDDLPS